MNKLTFLSRAKCLLLNGVAAVALTSISIGAQADEYTGPEITFEQIYAQPDNEELNLNYARQQAALGDYLTAAGTLERLLFAQPDWDSARLYYALVLHRLDDQIGANQQLDILDSRSLNAGQRQQVAIYRGEFGEAVSSGTGDGGFTGRVVTGVRYDNNSGNALADTFLAIANQDDLSAFAQGTLNYSAPFNGDSGLNFRAGVNGQTLRHTKFSKADYDTIGGHIGIGNKADGFSWALDGQAVVVYVSGSKYLTQIGPKLSVSTDISSDTKLMFSGAYYDQDYKDLAFTFGETTRSGDKVSILAAIRKKLSGNAVIGASIGYDDKSATNKDFAYNGLRFGVDFKNTLESGVYLKGRADYRMLNYDSAFPGVKRDDDHISGRISVGVPLSNMGSQSNNIAIEGGLTYLNRNSNFAGLDYENFGAELKLIFDF